MRYEDERYVRLYTRDTATWIAIGFEGRHVLMSLLRKVDRAGVLEVLEGEEVEMIAQMIMAPVEIVEKGFNKLIERRVVELSGGQLRWPKFLEAQECRTSDRERQRKSRELAALGHTASHGVTAGHSLSLLAVPSRAVPSRAVPSSDDPARDRPIKQRKGAKPAQPDLPVIPPPPPQEPPELTPIQWHFRDYQDQRDSVLTEELHLPFVADEPPNWPRITLSLGALLEKLETYGRPPGKAWSRLLELWFAEPFAAGMDPPFPFKALVSDRCLNGDPARPNLPGLLKRLYE